MRLLALLLLLLTPAIHAAVLAIDYGAEFTKLSLVKPGVPFDVVLDRDSKRKIQSVVGWKRDDRVFGQEGKMTATRFPESHYPYVKPLLGSSSLPTLPLYPNPPKLTPDGSLVFSHPSPPSHISPQASDEAELWTPTTLLAHQLSYFRDLATSLAPSEAAIEPINQVVVTVPAWWTQAQRRAYRDALELQGLTCLAMIGEGTGVALNYAMTRTFPNFDPATGEGSKEYHVIYDSGALATTATVVAFYQTSSFPSPKSKTAISTTNIEVLATGWSEVGGVVLDLAIQEILVKDFVGKTGQRGTREDKRAMAKLAKEAVRVKQILSANQESSVNVESLYEDIDYRSRLSRTDLESVLSPYLSYFSSPIVDALQTASLDLSNITSLILFGGNTRVPLVQSAIRDVLGGDEKIAQNVNADEAAVLGAAYYGAALSRQFKMKSIEVIERTVYPFTVGVGEDADVLFPKGSKLGERRSLTPAPEEEVVLQFYQGSNPVLSVELVDVPKALAGFTSPSPIVNLTMRLDPRGHLSTASATLASNVTAEESSSGMAGALKGLFGSKKDAEGDEPEVESKANKAEKVVLKFREKQLGSKHMTGEEKRTAQARLISIKAFESAKTAREEARNLLEGYLYRLSGLLASDADNRALHDYATQQERDVMNKLLRETSEWLSEHAEHADEKTLRVKRAELEKLEKPIIVRFNESRTRGKAIEAFQQAMFAGRSFLVEARKNNTIALESAASAPTDKPVAPPKYTDDELKVVEEIMKENEVWMDDKMKVQVTLDGDKTKDPVILSKDLDEKGKKLQMTVSLCSCLRCCHILIMN
ncbi:heat shock protein 70 family [Naematelia encephala]|uniref:Heat shock protein 70 family n=1 Tax=Naematelia encephala TaxID=71784 RepID=A0A1Y2AR22_9TREE|nr:heat shock protein 70 family [Naematelia encephala]